METKTKMTQCERVIDYIKQFGSISTLEAFNDLGIARLASRIYDLKKQGYDFNSVIKSRKNRYGEPTHFTVYSLADNGGN